jgi:hypothetical protein
MNNNKLDENSLLGTFAKTGYITIGTPEASVTPPHTLLSTQLPSPRCKFRWNANRAINLYEWHLLGCPCTLVHQHLPQHSMP